jgi:hypothetical protein
LSDLIDDILSQELAKSQPKVEKRLSVGNGLSIHWTPNIHAEAQQSEDEE